MTKWADFFSDGREYSQVFYSYISSFLTDLKHSIIKFNTKFGFSQTLLSVVNDKKLKDWSTTYWLYLSCRAFLLIILIKKFFYLHEEMTVLESKYWKTWNSANPVNVTFPSILTLVPSFLDENWNFFYQNDQQKKLCKIGFVNKLSDIFVFFRWL
jgi:hypothetical protein